MTIRVANEIRPASLPTYCSACFGQDPSKQHVDFDAAADRGYGEGNVAMDDLVLCETCVRRAGVLLGMTDDAELQGELTSLRRLLDREKYRADQADDYASKLELALDARPVHVSAPRRRGRPTKEDDYAGS